MMQLAGEFFGYDQSPLAQREYLWEVSGLVTGRRLTLSISYSAGQFRAQTMEHLAQAYHHQLLALIDHCTRQEQKQLTPSDLTYANLSLDQFDKINALFQ
jgi:non-ribosomal peptide synthase protein (TIGR01720 family)